MSHVTVKFDRRERRKKGLRKRMFGEPAKPRLSVFRSARHIYAQLIDDLSGRTIAAASTTEKGIATTNGGNCAAAEVVGKALAERATRAGVSRVVFDRNGYRYHGRIQKLAEAARKAGLSF